MEKRDLNQEEINDILIDNKKAVIKKKLKNFSNEYKNITEYIKIW